MIEKISRIINLYDFYQDLLTEKQRQYIESYYEDDLSLSEVAEKFNVSRNAVHDNLKRVESILEGYEEKLRLKEKYDKRQLIISKLKEMNISDIQGLLNKLEEI